MAGGIAMGFLKGLMPCRVTFASEGMTEEARTENRREYYGVCVFGETSGEILTDDGRRVLIEGKAVIDGDAAPGLAVITGGVFEVDTPDGTRKMKIARARRVRAGSLKVRHTVLELV
jgi:hypothetical protein